MPIRPEMRARYPKDWKLRSYFVRFVRARGACEPALGRVANGVDHRVDRLKAIGNGQVPSVAAMAFLMLADHLCTDFGRVQENCGDYALLDSPRGRALGCKRQAGWAAPAILGALALVLIFVIGVLDRDKSLGVEIVSAQESGLPPPAVTHHWAVGGNELLSSEIGALPRSRSNIARVFDADLHKAKLLGEHPQLTKRNEKREERDSRSGPGYPNRRYIVISLLQSLLFVGAGFGIGFFGSYLAFDKQRRVLGPALGWSGLALILFGFWWWWSAF